MASAATAEAALPKFFEFAPMLIKLHTVADLVPPNHSRKHERSAEAMLQGRARGVPAPHLCGTCGALTVGAGTESYVAFVA